jgi:aminoglycoside phosphotransferase (APT) family kinase protein
VERDGALASRIAARHGLPVEPIEELTGRGSVNHVFVVGAPSHRFVIRFAVDPLRADEFATEAWCLQLARSAAIPSPETIAHGTLDGAAYGIQRFVSDAGRNRISRRRLWEMLGRYARTVNKAPLTADAPQGLYSRFGRDLSAAWQAHLAYNLAELTDEDHLLALQVYPRAAQPQLRGIIRGLAATTIEFGLSHGDLAARNVLVPPTGAPVLMDWGSASCGPVPFTDLLILQGQHDHTGDPRADELEAFSLGYGLDLDELAPTMDAMRRLTALDLVRWAVERRPDRLPELVPWARAELAGPRRAVGEPGPVRRQPAQGPT